MEDSSPEYGIHLPEYATEADALCEAVRATGATIRYRSRFGVPVAIITGTREQVAAVRLLAPDLQILPRMDYCGSIF